MPTRDPNIVRLPIRVTTDPSGAIVGVERTPPSTPRARDNPAPFKCWRSDVFLNDERLQECDSEELLAPHGQVELVFTALCDTARRQSPPSRFVEFRSWAEYHDAVRSHPSCQGALA